MKTKFTITIIAVLNVLQGIGFVLGGESLTKQSIPKDKLTEESIKVGSAMHWPLGVAFIVTGIILFSTRGLQLLEAKKVLLYTGLAYVFFLINGLLQNFTTPVIVPIPAIVLIAVFAALSIYTSRTAKS